MKKIFFIFILIFHSYLISQELKIHYIDVNQGAATLIEYTNHFYLIDSGKNRANNKLITYLQEHNVTNLDACVITHPDTDHIGEFEDLIESNINIAKFIKNQDTASTQTYTRLMNLINQRQIPIEIVDYQTNLNWVINTDILSPNYTWGHNDANSNSIVISLSFANFKFLFLADSENSNNEDLLNTYNLDSDVMQLPHHGAANSFSSALLQEVSPNIAIIQSGNNSYGHPARTVVEELIANEINVYSTADDYNTWWLQPAPVNGSDDSTFDDDIILVCDGNSIIVNNDVVVKANNNCNNLTKNNINIFPNPFNPTTTVSFASKNIKPYKLDVYNIKGQHIKCISRGISKTGTNTFTWKGLSKNNSKCASGIYFFKLRIDNKNIVKKALMLK